jgi:imidazolonepropionase-like amidohydrolase
MILALIAAACGLDSGGLVAVKAGTIHTVESDAPIEGGGVVLVDDGRIVAVGKDLEIPAGARVVDYGPDAVIAPGLVAADSSFGLARPSERTADLGVLAIDGFDPYASYVFALQEGVTSAYLPPARGRLIAGQGAVVKLGGRGTSGGDARVLSASAMIHGAVSAEARNTPGYWQPPIPATVDVGMGFEQPQLPRSLMGAIVGLREILDVAQGNGGDRGYGPGLGAKVREMIAAKRPWRMAAANEPEVRALLELFGEKGLPLVIDGLGASEVSPELAAAIGKAGASAIVEAPYDPNRPGRDLGKDKTVRLPSFEVASALERAGVPFAITTSNQTSASELRFAAEIASRGGLARKDALKAITLSAARILGVADRVGSLAPGKDADFVVYNSHPLEPGSSVVATWIDGDVVYKRAERTAVVLSVDELYSGDGDVLRPGEILMLDGRIREVGTRVGRPAGATIVHGKAAMPGMIDAFGLLGLEGSARVPATRFDLARILEPDEPAARRVAQSGVTTVVLSPRGTSRTGAPVLAYKPAGADIDKMVVRNPTALRFQWTERNRVESGKNVREVLEKAAEYSKKWDEYEKKLAAWTPPKEGAESKAEPKPDGKSDGEGKAGAEEGKSEKKEGAESKAEEGKKEPNKEEGKKEDKKGSGKKGDKDAAKPITGAWEGEVVVPPFEKARLRLYVLDEDGKVSGSLRCSSLSAALIEISGERKEKKVELSGDADRGKVSVSLEEKDGKLSGKVTQGSASADVQLSQTSTEYEVAKRAERRKPKEPEKKEIKGQPRAPGVDPELDPLRRAMKGQGAVVVGVDREDEILDCVAAFEGVGIKPILLGARDAWKVVDKLQGRVAGVLLGQQITWIEPKTGAKKRNRYAELVQAGIPIAFHSDAEEGAGDVPSMAAFAVSQGLGADAALRALTSDAARMFAIDRRVGTLAPGLDADVALLDGSPLELSTRVVRVWVAGEEVR